MSSSKTTVLGIRLDSDRRGWIEAEAARQGVSIRTYFERMIDEARSVDEDPLPPAEESPEESAVDVGSETGDDIAGYATRAKWSTSEPAPVPEPLGPSTISSTTYPGLSDEMVSSFERMIDDARSGASDSVELGEPIDWPTEADTESELQDDTAALIDDTAALITGAEWPPSEPDYFPEPPLGVSTSAPTSSHGICDDVVAVAAIPCRVFREALGFSRALVKVVTRPFRRHRASF